LDGPIHQSASTEQQSLKASGRKWDQFFKDGLAYLHQLLLDNDDQRTVFISRSGMGQGATDWLKRASENGEPSVYAAIACNYCHSRCFLTTSEGRMGIGPADSARGDAVAVIFGGAVPYVIRENRSSPGRSWAFVGESYISGLMNGEAIEELRRGTNKTEVLEVH